MKFSKIRFDNFVLLLSLYFLMRSGYSTVVEYWGYEGFVFHDQNRILICFLIILTFSILLSSIEISPFLYCINIIISIFFLLPSLIQFEKGSLDWSFVFGSIWIHIILLVAGSKKNIVIPVNRHENFKKSIPILLGLIFIFIIPIIITFGIPTNYNVFLLQDIYEVRAHSRDISNPIVAYSKALITNVSAPILLIIAIIDKKPMILIITIVSLLYVFLCYSQKSIFFSIPFLILFYYNSFEKKARFLLITIVVIFIMWLFLLPYNIYNLLLGSTIVRLFYLPTLINTFYYEFFNNKFIYFSNTSIIKWFVPYKYPYAVDPPFLIGENYFHNSFTSANTGILADGFINIGFLGMIIFATLFSMIFIFIDKMQINHRFFGVFFVMIISFQNSAFFTTLLTHGTLFLLLILYWLLRTNK